LALAGGVTAVIVIPTANAAASCAAGWSSSAVYTKGMAASYQGTNYEAQWWTQNENPATGNGSGVWANKGACGGGSTQPTATPTKTAGNTCGGAAAWVAGKWYVTGNIVTYTDGKQYIAEHDNPGYDPIISTWYWEPYTCSGGTQPPNPTNPPNPSGFVVSEAQFNQMFPNRNSFYTYQGLVTAASAFPAFAKTGSDTVKKQEAAAFLANVNHETGGLVHVVEQNTANYSHYCDTSQSYGCPAGQSAYYGRGPIQLSWNFNYKAAGDALGIDLLRNPNLVQTDPAVAWKTGLWYWMTQNGPGTMTAHNAMVNGNGFGETIRSINGSLECGGRNPAQVQSRINSYQSYTQILGVPAGKTSAAAPRSTRWPPHREGGATPASRPCGTPISRPCLADCLCRDGRRCPCFSSRNNKEASGKRAARRLWTTARTRAGRLRRRPSRRALFGGRLQRRGPHARVHGHTAVRCGMDPDLRPGDRPRAVYRLRPLLQGLLPPGTGTGRGRRGRRVRLAGPGRR
jgi:chitinase